MFVFVYAATPAVPPALRAQQAASVPPVETPHAANIYKTTWSSWTKQIKGGGGKSFKVIVNTLLERQNNYNYMLQPVWKTGSLQQATTHETFYCLKWAWME